MTKLDPECVDISSLSRESPSSNEDNNIEYIKLINEKKGIFLIKKYGRFYIEKRVKKTSKFYPFEKNGNILLKPITHPHLIQIIECYEDSEYLFVIMEYGESGDLYKDILHQKYIGLKYKLPCLYEMYLHIILGLHTLHSQNIIHRDIKPQNIMISNHKLKIGDFGLTAPLTNIKEGVGTMEYISPEIMRKEKYDLSSDIWSLGITFHFMIHLKLPYDFEYNTKEHIKEVIKSGKLSINQSIPELLPLFERMLNPDKTQRPTTIQLLSHPKIVKVLLIYYKKLEESEYKKDIEQIILKLDSVYWT